jgi:enoyl-[acyl-carrier protein] reductase II
MKNIICEKIGIEYPILQGPMAWASDSTLSASVSNAGGLGVMGIGFCPTDVFRAEIQKIKSLTNKPFGLNLLTCLPNSQEMLEIILQEKVPVVEIETAPTAFETLPEYVAELKDAGVTVIGKGCSVNEALILEKAGVDFVSIKGADGGGHIYGFSGTFSLIPQVVDALSIPVINSSGVADGRGIAASFMLGAKAVEIGSRFLLAHECAVHENYKTAILNSKEGDTVITGASIDDAVRMIKNNLSKKMLKIEKDYDKEEAAKRMQILGSGSLRKAAVDGEVENEGTVTVGQVSGMLNKIQSVNEIMTELVKEYTKILKNTPQLL